jgi:endonuclease/exonuclease/phosphatase family metal-dependent hydrolase
MTFKRSLMMRTAEWDWSRLAGTAKCFLAVWLMSLLPVAAGLAEEIKTRPPGTLGIMTYDIHFGTTIPPNTWGERRLPMRELILRISPDVMGTQEGHHFQLTDLTAGLPGYDWIGDGCEDGKLKGKYVAIFYRKARLEPLSTNTFWLSDTPEVPGSTTWGNRYPLQATTVKFRDLQTKQEFYVINVRFNVELQVAKEKSAALIRERVEALKTSLPVVVLGNFGAGADQNKVYNQMVDDKFFKDTWILAKERIGDGLGTLNEYKAMPTGEPRMDWILVHGKVTVDTAAIDTFISKGHFPSDHCPVVAWLRFGE